MFYQHSITEVRNAIEQVKPGTSAKECVLEIGMPATLEHILWMCDRIQEMDTSSEDELAKASRWIGWIYAQMEILRIWNSGFSRSLASEDRKHYWAMRH